MIFTMRKTWLLILSLTMNITDITQSFCQGVTAPHEGNAVIYFTRVTSLGFAIPFDFFDGEKYIGDFAGKNYMRYECSPGEHLFWASSENKAFMTADVAANSIYIVIVDLNMGIGMARVGLSPIDANNEVFPRAKALIQKKKPIVVTDEELQAENVRLAEFIHEKLKKYDEEWKNTLEIKNLKTDMAIPQDKAI
jgi:hypothetical protein